MPSYPLARSFNGEGDWTAYKAVIAVHLGQIHGIGRTVQIGTVVLFDGITVEILPSGNSAGAHEQPFGFRYINRGFQAAIDAGYFVEDADFHFGGLRIMENGASVGVNVDTLNFSGGVTATIDGTDQSQANVDITGGGGTGTGTTVVSAAGAYTAPAAVAVGDFVYSTGDDQVDLSDNASMTTLPAIGVVIGKTSSTTVTVAYFGEVDIFAGLIAGDCYYMGTLGSMTNIAPATLGVVQRLGIALNSTTLLLVANDVVIL